MASRAFIDATESCARDHWIKTRESLVQYKRESFEPKAFRVFRALPRIPLFLFYRRMAITRKPIWSARRSGS